MAETITCSDPEPSRDREFIDEYGDIWFYDQDEGGWNWCSPDGSFGRWCRSWHEIIYSLTEI